MVSQLWLLLVVLGGIGAWSAHRRLRRRVLEVIECRDELDDQDIYSAFYGDSGLPQSSVRDAWHEIADSLKLPAGKIRPTDRFGKDIGIYLITSPDLDTLHERGVRRAKQLGLRPDFEAVRTVDDYVRVLATIPGE